MDTRKMIRNGRNRRGAALITVVFAALFLAALLVVAFVQSHTSSSMAIMRENYAKAVAASEYGAELAMAQLLSVKRGSSGVADGADTTSAKEGAVTGDFVFGEFSSSNNGNMYATSGGSATDQRRIAGIMDNQQFRVRVRSARLAHDNDMMKSSWLDVPADFDYKDATTNFKDIYEITSTAQNHLAAEGKSVQGNLYPTAVVRSVVRLDNSGAGDALDEMGTLDADPENIQAANMLISGEDHDLRQFYIEGGESTEASYTKVSQSGASSGDFTGVAEGGYWKAGSTILNYMRGDTPVPFYPYNKTLPTSDYYNDSRKLVSMGTYYVTDPADVALVSKAPNFIKERSDNTLKKLLTIKDDGIAKKFISSGALDNEADIYLVGGKSSNSVGYSGKTYETYEGEGKDKRLVAMHPWYIAETGVKFDIVLSDYDDLLRIYSIYKGSATSTPAPTDTTFSLSSSPTAQNNNGESVTIKEDNAIRIGEGSDRKYDKMNFVGGKVQKGQAIANNTSLPDYTDPFDNNTLPKKSVRYYGRQYVLRTNPDSKEQEMLVMNVKPVKPYLELSGNIEGIMAKEIEATSSNGKTKTTRLYTIGFPKTGSSASSINIDENWSDSDYKNWKRVVLWEAVSNDWGDGKKVLWSVPKDEMPIKMEWDAAKGKYLPVNKEVIIQIPIYPRQDDTVAWNPETVPLSVLKKVIQKIWPNILDHPITEADGELWEKYKDAADRTFKLRWDELSFIKLDGSEQTFDGLSASAGTTIYGLKSYVSSGAASTSSNTFSSKTIDFPGLYISNRTQKTASDSGQWFEWDGTYTWSEYRSVGDSDKTHFENKLRSVSQIDINNWSSSNFGKTSSNVKITKKADYLQAGFNIMPRPFELDEILGMKLDHDYTTVWSKRYSIVSPVDENGKAIKKAEDFTYPGSIPVALTGPVKDSSGKWSAHRGDDTGEYNLNSELGLTGLWVWEPNDPQYRSYEEYPDNPNPKLFSSISDFLEKKKFGDVERDALTLWVALEDQDSGGADWDYNDVAFIVSIAPPVLGEANRQMNSVEKMNKQWWEQHEQEGLTGGESNAAISTNRIDGSDDPAKAYEKLWNKLTINDWFALSVDRRVGLRDKANGMGVKTDAINEEWYTADNEDALRESKVTASFEDVKGTIIAVLASDVYSMMSESSREFTGFEFRGEFYCDYSHTVWGGDYSLPVAVHLRNLSDIPSGSQIFYSDNDVEYYRAVLDTVFSEISNAYEEHVYNGGTDAAFDVKWPRKGVNDYFPREFMNMWKNATKEQKLKYAKRKLVYHLSGSDTLNDATAPGNDKNLFLYSSASNPKLDTSTTYSSGFKVEFISGRDDEFFHLLVAVNSGGLDNEGNEKLNALKIRQKGISPREFTAAIFNPKETLVRQSLVTGVTADLDNTDTWTLYQDPGSSTYKAKIETLTFVAGEIRQNPNAKTVSPLDTPIPFNENFTDLNGSEKKVISPNFLAASEKPEDLAKAVRECYKPYYSDNQRVREIIERWGLKDSRRSIGWHRYGSVDENEDPDLYKDLVSENLLDNLEVIMLGVNNFMPYYTTVATSAPYETETIVQKRRVYELPATDPEFSESETGYEESVPLRTGKGGRIGEDLPTFVFPIPEEYRTQAEKDDDTFGPIDGAGIMVVNGNLLVKDTFAFHGILIVLGAIEVQGTLNENRILYGDDGNPYFISGDGKTYSLRRDENGNYYYEDDKGNKVYEHTYTDASGHTHTETVAPVRAKDDPDASNYTGRLVVQGGVVAGGEITTTSEVEGGPLGSFEVYHSQTIKDEIASMIPEGSPFLEKLVWDHNDNIDVTTIWNDQLDAKKGGASSGDSEDDGEDGTELP